jgi:Peptidase M10 serralysin C terminal/Cadherin domain/Bacterial pre-peptidase C-terminal domain
VWAALARAARWKPVGFHAGLGGVVFNPAREEVRTIYKSGGIPGMDRCFDPGGPDEWVEIVKRREISIMPAANKANRPSTTRNLLLSTALATGGAVLLAGGAQAQPGAATPPSGFSPISDLEGVSRVEMGADGSVQLIMADGRTVLIAAEDVSVVDGVVYLADAAIEANALAGAAAAAGGGGGAAVLGLLGGAGLIGAAAGGGGGGGSTPPPAPPPNTNPPVFSSATTASVDENTTGTVYTATATDADGNSISFSIVGGADSALFSINSSTGAVTFNAPPDFENPTDAGADNSYEITIRASDGTNTTDQTVTISVGDVDEAPTFTSAAAVSVDENTTGTVYTATATDPEGGTLTYSLGGADAALFAIDAATGEVSFVAAPDFENPADADGDNAYEITVTSSDGTNDISQAVTITVDPVDEGAAVFSSGTTASFDENATGTVYTAVAADVDNSTITYSLGSGGDGALFAIDSATGALTFIAPPDFEAPADGNGDNVYSVVVRANDGNTTTTQTVLVTVNDVNESPTITSAAAVSVDENTAGTVYTATATDPEGDTLSFSLSGADAALFVIDAATGAVRFLAAPDYENPADADGDNVYEITVSASDGTNSTVQAVAITVDAVDEGPAVFSSGTTASFDENATGTVYTAVAVDPDNNPVNYSLGSGGDSALFVIDSATGALTFVTPPDFEAPADGNGDNVYSVVVRANDGDTTATQTVLVTVNDVDETPAVTSAATASVAENAAGVVYTATATDPESGAITYSLTGTDAALFSIDATTGAVSFLAPPDFEAPADSNGDNVYDIIINASDGTNTGTQAVAVSVTNLNEFSPVFTSATTDAVDEDTAGSFYTATATDADGDTLTYSISGGADQALFQIDATTGALSFITPPDFENPADADTDNVYELVLQVSDGTVSTGQNLTVTVNNVNAAPVITSAATANFNENGAGVVYTIAATDGDADTISYSISGADAALFSVDSVTGAVSFLVSPDFEAPTDANGDNVYQINVIASDGTVTDTQGVAISVLNQNDVAPVITSGATATTAENVTGTVYTATATDAEGDTITYSLTGTDAALFQIDSATGAVSFLTAPDFENPADSGGDNVYDVTVVASDGALTDTQNVAITVTNVNEADAPVFNSGASQTVSENQSSAYVARATDPQGDTITYSISGTDAALFSIDAASGEVSFLTAPDFEAPGDAGGDNVYDITVVASDGTNSNSQNVAITVGNVSAEGADVPESASTQIAMVSGGDYTGQLEVAGDRDWVAITLEAGQRYQFDAFGSGGAGTELTDTYLRLYDGSGTLLAENDDITLGVNTDSRLGFTATTSGTYYVSVGAYEPSSGANLTGQYTLQVRHTDPLTAWNYQEIGDYLDANGFGGLQWDRAAGDIITVNITALTGPGQILARAALQLWEDITGIQFNEVVAGGNITFDDDEEGAFAGPDTVSGGFITSASVNVGTAWLDTYGTNLDGYSFQTYIHEIGHALGLGHGGPYDGSADYAVDAIYLNDSWQASVMSYFSQNENTFITADFGYVIGPQVADIIAVLDMYGGSTTTRGGDTTYGYNSNAGNTIFDATAFSNPVSFTIFDTGGIDTLDYSGSGANQIFDLREQAYSSLMGRDGNIGIARGTVIENAIGGNGNDVFVGNDANNTLTGGGGADRFYASGGSDVFNGGSGNDTAVFSGASTDYTITTNGSGNTVVTDNRAGTPDGVVELISVESIVYDGGTSNPEYFGDPDFSGSEGLDPDNLPALAPSDSHFVSDDWDHPVMSDHGGDDKDGGHEPHIYPHLTDDDLALLETLTHHDGNSRGSVGPDALLVGVPRGVYWEAFGNHEIEPDAAYQAQSDKGHPVFEGLTLPSAAGLAVAQAEAIGATGFDAFPDDHFSELFDAREAQMLTLSDDASDGWA